MIFSYGNDNNMKNTKTTKQLSLFAVIAVTAIVSSLFGINLVIAEQTESIPENSITLSSGNSDFLAKDGVRSMIVISSDDKQVIVNKGKTTTTTFTITHEANDVNAKAVTLEAKGIKGLFTTASAIQSRTAHELSEEFKETGTIQGSINFSPFATFSPNTIVLSPGEFQIITMQIQIPETISTELLDKSLRFQPDIHKVGDYGSQKIGIDNASVYVTIVE